MQPPPAGLVEILACPRCRGEVVGEAEGLRCVACGRCYPVVGGVPVMLPGEALPGPPEQPPGTRDSYFPWVHRVVLQSLLDDQRVLEMGSGNQTIDDPCIVRMDVHLTPHVDVVGDAHQLPFRDGVFDFVFSLAVVEHLRQPFQAAAEIHRVMRDGGYVYHECNFVFAYHGYPHHYFNASLQGLEQVLGRFRALRTGVAPYQMPSFALEMLVSSYLCHSTAALERRNLPFLDALQGLLEFDLVLYDRHFTEAAAANVAAGVFFFGLKQDSPSSTVIPQPFLLAWESDPALRARIPDPLDLGRADNLLRWGVTEGRARPEIATWLEGLRPFDKRGAGRPFDRSVLRAMPVVEPRFGILYDYPKDAPPPKPPPRGWRRLVPRAIRRWLRSRSAFVLARARRRAHRA